jgi:23S rRNA pseudoU1915 N3-methylase RlmH
VIKLNREIKEQNVGSNLQMEKDKATHSSEILNKIDNKKFALSLAGLFDIYSVFSSVVCDLQTVNQLPFERYDKFQKKMKSLQEITDILHDHSKCDKERCSWPKIHSDKSNILSGKLNKDVIIKSDEPGTTIFTRSIAQHVATQAKESYEESVYKHLTTYITTLYQELSTVFNADDRKCIKIGRYIADWGSVAVKLKTRSVSVYHLLEKAKFVESCYRMDRNLRSISKEDIESQYKTFLLRLFSVTQYRTCTDLEESDPKQIIKYFFKHEHL